MLSHQDQQEAPQAVETPVSDDKAQPTTDADALVKQLQEQLTMTKAELQANKQKTEQLQELYGKRNKEYFALQLELERAQSGLKALSTSFCKVQDENHTLEETLRNQKKESELTLKTLQTQIEQLQEQRTYDKREITDLNQTIAELSQLHTHEVKDLMQKLEGAGTSRLPGVTESSTYSTNEGQHPTASMEAKPTTIASNPEIEFLKKFKEAIENNPFELGVFGGEKLPNGNKVPKGIKQIYDLINAHIKENKNESIFGTIQQIASKRTNNSYGFFCLGRRQKSTKELYHTIANTGLETLSARLTVPGKK
jgi:hypothetical protein